MVSDRNNSLYIVVVREVSQVSTYNNETTKLAREKPQHHLLCYFYPEKELSTPYVHPNFYLVLKSEKFIKAGYTLGITVETLSSQEKIDDQWLRYRPLAPINMGNPMKYSLYPPA